MVELKIEVTEMLRPFDRHCSDVLIQVRPDGLHADRQSCYPLRQPSRGDVPAQQPAERAGDSEAE
jgi:hypothetical protein